MNIVRFFFLLLNSKKGIAYLFFCHHEHKVSSCIERKGCRANAYKFIIY